jgi:glycoside/pentoside/hexuronide:cation symporter, GPH family
MTAADRLPLRTLLAFGLPGFPLAALTVPLYIYLPAFYADEMGLGLTAVGTILLAARLFDVVIDPVVGMLSDRWSTRIGRRRPWLILGTPLALLAVFRLFRPEPGIGDTYLLVWTVALYLAWTILLLPYYAWAAELSPDYHERARITGFRESFVILGTLAAAGLPALKGGSATGGAALALLALLMMVALPIAVGVAVTLVPERPVAPVPAAGFGGWRAILENRPFLRLIAAYLLNGLGNGLTATLFTLFASHVVRVPQLTGALLFVYFLAGILAVPFWLLLSRKLGKHRAWAISLIWTGSWFVWAPLLGPGDVIAYAVISVMTGFGLGADLTLPSAMQADIVDLDTLGSGARRAGLYFALWGMATKLALALAVGIAFPLLDLAGFDPAAQENSAGALLTLGLLYAVVPIAIKLGAVLLIWNYPLDAAEHARVRRQLEALPVASV